MEYTNLQISDCISCHVCLKKTPFGLFSTADRDTFRFASTDNIISRAICFDCDVFLNDSQTREFKGNIFLFSWKIITNPRHSITRIITRPFYKIPIFSPTCRFGFTFCSTRLYGIFVLPDARICKENSFFNITFFRIENNKHCQ